MESKQKTLPLTKVCSNCGKEKPAEEFSLSTRSADGLYTYCKPCDRIKGQQRRSEATRLKAEIAELKKQLTAANDISVFADKELTDELKRRGYTGKLRYNKEVEL